ncbi:hypothetical protein D3C84_1226300 [compost metagenome]
MDHDDAVEQHDHDEEQHAKGEVIEKPVTDHFITWFSGGRRPRPVGLRKAPEMSRIRGQTAECQDFRRTRRGTGPSTGSCLGI